MKKGIFRSGNAGNDPYGKASEAEPNGSNADASGFERQPSPAANGELQANGGFESNVPENGEFGNDFIGGGVARQEDLVDSDNGNSNGFESTFFFKNSTF